MGKPSGSSWIGLMKKAFRSPVKENNMIRSSRRREDADQEEEEEKKRGKRRWIFRKPICHEITIHHTQQANTSGASTSTNNNSSSINIGKNLATNSSPDHNAADSKAQRRAIAVAMATTAAAEAAVATAQAAVDIIRLTRPALLVKEQRAVLTIQTAFRGYLARKALQALKGVVKLQALIRGHNVRKRAKMTLQCMQSLVRVQTQVCDQRRRLSCEGISSGSNFKEPKSSSDVHFRDRESNSRNQASHVDDRYDHSNALEKLEALLQKAKEATKQRENSLAFAFSQQMWSSDKDEDVSSNKDLDDDFRHFHRTNVKNCKNLRRVSCHQTRECIKNIEVDTACSYSDSDTDFWRLQHQFYQDQQQKFSPFQRNLLTRSPMTPPCKMKTMLVHSASPRCRRDERSNRMSPLSHRANLNGLSRNSVPATGPSYMAATASARARERSQNTPRQMPLTPEREKYSAAKKRLSFRVPEIPNENVQCDQPLDHRLVSPRWKSM